LISCNCIFENIGPIFGWTYQPATYSSQPPYVIQQHPTNGLPQDVYDEGPTPEQRKRFEQMLHEKGRIPYIRWPNLCAYCGKLWPEMFHVSKEEWERYIEPAKRNAIVCRECYDRIKELIDKHR